MWKNIEIIANYSKHALYMIRLVDDTNKPEKIGRWLGDDLAGILYIGKTDNLKNRLKRIRNGCNSGGNWTNASNSGHPAGNMIWLLRSDMIKDIKPKNLQYQYEEKKSDAEAKIDEENAIRKYVRKYGEVPPLNSNIPNREVWAKSLFKN